MCCVCLCVFGALDQITYFFHDLNIPYFGRNLKYQWLQHLMALNNQGHVGKSLGDCRRPTGCIYDHLLAGPNQNTNFLGDQR